MSCLPIIICDFSAASLIYNIWFMITIVDKLRIFSTIISQNQKLYNTAFFKLCSRCASLRIILNIP